LPKEKLIYFNSAKCLKDFLSIPDMILLVHYKDFNEYLAYIKNKINCPQKLKPHFFKNSQFLEKLP